MGNVPKWFNTFSKSWSIYCKIFKNCLTILGVMHGKSKFKIKQQNEIFRFSTSWESRKLSKKVGYKTAARIYQSSSSFQGKSFLFNFV